ncbi:MAG TPA: LysE family translocator [Dongiaceae bacterium]|nr:LysE family translocator [Dongiaceae bacterium]
MTIETWLAFAFASILLCLIPGPTVLMVVSYGLGQGRRAALATVLGVFCGDFVAMTASMAGLGTVLLASAQLFTILKIAGAAYLLYLGVKLWRAPAIAGRAASGTSPARMVAHAFAVTALNPKTIIFFIAFVPQFISAARPLLPQLILCEATFLVIGSLNALGYALAAQAARGWIARPRTGRAINRVGGTLLVGAGLFAAFSSRRG